MATRVPEDGVRPTINPARRHSPTVTGFRLAQPNVDSVVAGLPSCVGLDNPPRYEPAVYRGLDLAFYNASDVHRSGYGKAPSTQIP